MYCRLGHSTLQKPGGCVTEEKYEYNASEEFLMYSFDKLFLFEFYVRKLRLNQSKEFESLLQLKEDIEGKFDGLAYLNEEGITIEDLVIFVLNFLQFDDEISQLPSLLDEWDISDKLIADIVDVCQKLENTPKVNLANCSYKHADLVYSNDILKVISWWNDLTDERKRGKSGLEGKFGAVNEGVDSYVISEFDFSFDDLEDQGTYKTIYNFEFRCPEIIAPKRDSSFKEDNYRIFNSNYDVIDINNETQLNSLLLSIPTDQSVDDIDAILEEFKLKLYLLQAQNNWDLLNPEIDPTAEAPVSINVERLVKVPESSPYKAVIKDKRKCNQFLTRYDSICKWLIGLYCYDIGVEKRLNQSASADVVKSHLEKLNCFQTFEKRTIKKDCKAVTNIIVGLSKKPPAKPKVRIPVNDKLNAATLW